MNDKEYDTITVQGVYRLWRRNFQIFLDKLETKLQIETSNLVILSMKQRLRGKSFREKKLLLGGLNECFNFSSKGRLEFNY